MNAIIDCDWVKIFLQQGMIVHTVMAMDAWEQ